MTKIATCNSCNADICFDAYVDINGEVVAEFDNWVCSKCDNRGKHQDSNNGYTITRLDKYGAYKSC